LLHTFVHIKVNLFAFSAIATEIILNFQLVNKLIWLSFVQLFNSVVSDLLESDKKLPLKTYEHVTGLLSNAVRNYIPKYGRPYSMSELKHSERFNI
jgi:hypothetical protein